MILTAQRRHILTQLTPNLFDAPNGRELVQVMGPRGALKGYEVTGTTVVVGAAVIRKMIEDGLIDQDLKITSRGQLYLQDAIADAA